MASPIQTRVLLVVLRRTEGDESQCDESRDDEELHVGEVVERLEQRRLAVEDDVVMLRRPEPNFTGIGGLSDRKFVDLFPEPSGMVDDLLGDEVRVDDFEVLVGDDEGDVVAVGHDVGHERVLNGPHDIAADAFHGVCPEGDVVLLLSLELPGHVVGVEQGQGPERNADDDDDEPVPEGEFLRVEFHVGFISGGVLFGYDPAILLGVVQHVEGPLHIGIPGERVLDHAGLVAVAHDDVVVDRSITCSR